MKRRPIPPACLLVSAALAVSGCTLTPKYERPALPVADSFHAAAVQEDAAHRPVRPAAAPAPAASALSWRELFTDARLRSVIELALAGNRDLRIAGLNVERARALYRIQGAELNPSLGIQAAVDRHRVPEKLGENGQASVASQASVGLGLASWELDLFGRLRSLKARALEQYLASEEARRGARTSLVAAVAGAWLRLAADTETLRLARATRDVQVASYELIGKSRDAGLASDLELRQSQSQVEAARASVAAFTGAVAVDRNALDLLVGAGVGPELLPDGFEAVADARAISAGLPSDVLLGRPDVLAAEHQLRAANASIGAARAAFFPRISLTAGFGTMSPDLEGLFASGTRAWSFAGEILSPLFASGSLVAGVKVSRADRDIAVSTYEKTIQTAFAEVNDALALRTTLVSQREALEALVEALGEVSRLSDARFKAGLDGYLGVLVAQQALYEAQRALVGIRLAEQANVVTLYKVLGGGA